MANKRIIELQERTSIDMGDWLIVDSSTSTRKLSLATLFNYMTLTSMIFVTELPTTDISESTIYLVPHSGSTTDWDEYIYRDNEWIQIGTSTIDLSAIYQTKTDNNLRTTSKQIVGGINEVKSGLPVLITGTSPASASSHKYINLPAGYTSANTLIVSAMVNTGTGSLYNCAMDYLHIDVSLTNDNRIDIYADGSATITSALIKVLVQKVG